MRGRRSTERIGKDRIEDPADREPAEHHGGHDDEQEPEQHDHHVDRVSERDVGEVAHQIDAVLNRIDHIRGSVGGYLCVLFLRIAMADTTGTEPLRPTYGWSPDPVACGRCGEPTRRRWREDDRLVCPACKSW